MTRRRMLTLGAATAAVGALGELPASAAPYPPSDFSAADPANFTEDWRPSTYAITQVVVHVTQETYADTLRLFADPDHGACAHYVVRSADGHITQTCSEKNIAWHAGNWSYNTHSIGVEHEGWIDQPRYFTPAMYASSARLVRAICDRYQIPLDREHIIGHVEIPDQRKPIHIDPGTHWDWNRYMKLIRAAS